MEMKKIFTLAYFLAFLAIASSSCREDRVKLSSPAPVAPAHHAYRHKLSSPVPVASAPRSYHHKLSSPVPVASAPRSYHHKLSSPVPVAPAQSPDASMAAVCSDVIFEMMDCVTYLSDGSPSNTRPGSKCCKGAKSVVKFNGKCVCVAIETSSELGIQLNMTRVQALPSLCGIDYSFDNCGSPSGSYPSPSPVEAPVMTPVPVKAPAMTPVQVEAPAMTPDPVEAPAMTPGPVEAPAMTPYPVEAPAMTPDLVEAPAMTPYSVEAPAMSPDPSQAPSMTPDPVQEPPYPETCYDIMYNMMECIPYLVKGSTWRQPGHPCCEGYKFTLDFDGKCICTTLKSSGELGIQLNMTRVDGLPSWCGLEHGYPLHKCAINVHPESSPPGSRTEAPKDSGSPSLMSSSFTATVVSSIAISMLFLLSY